MSSLSKLVRDNFVTRFLSASLHTMSSWKDFFSARELCYQSYYIGKNILFNILVTLYGSEGQGEGVLFTAQSRMTCFPEFSYPKL